MAYRPSDSSGTDDDLLPPHLNRMPRGGDRSGANMRFPAGKLMNIQSDADMEARIRRAEQEAYCAVLRAFNAQSDAVSWEKEELISELRKELRVSDMEHRALLGKVNRDDTLKHIRENRQGTSNQHRYISAVPHSAVKTLDSTVSASFKKQKISPMMASLPQAILPSTMHAAPGKLASSAAGRGVVGGGRGRKSKGMQSVDVRWDCDGPLEMSRGSAGHNEKFLANNGGRGKGYPKGQGANGYATFQNGTFSKKPENIELRETDKLIKEVERVCRDHPDPSVVENAKMALRDQEQSLLEAIKRLESDEEDCQMPHSNHTHANQERMWRNRQVNGNGGYNKEDISGGRRAGGSNRNPMVESGGISSDDQQEDEYGDEDG
ncbi:protein EMSY-LIKE 1 isoform X1 [Cryptomeria japonica]|uniref:protein EMSY-LIKE 1 isoform X1 n=1 Tax=Cryptomeria japonica TaxID=3369 RepID=UPI0025AC1FA5|nr:protein EMSY-LIKE 1 isoform X1 [Cryptomeria japonica]